MGPILHVRIFRLGYVLTWVQVLILKNGTSAKYQRIQNELALTGVSEYRIGKSTHREILNLIWVAY